METKARHPLTLRAHTIALPPATGFSRFKEGFMGAVARLFVFGACLTVATSSSAFAQQRGSITGKVSDAGGLPLARGDRDGDTGGRPGSPATAVTAETGAYSVPNLEPGTYIVTVEMPGFASLKRADLLLTAGLRHHARSHAAGGRRPGGGDRHRRVAARREDEQPDRRQPVAKGDRGRAVELPQLHRPDAADSRA